MELREGEQIEFKREMNTNALKTIVAFANTNGGTLFVGMEDDGIPVDAFDADREITRATSMIRDSIKPDVLAMVSLEAAQIGGGDVLAIHVGRGVRRPYYLAAKGPRPEGVFIRSGAATVPASDTVILRMIQQSESDAYESRPSLLQNLTFDYAKSRFEGRGLSFGAGEMRTLGLSDADGRYTNLALLLSDQCPPSIKAAEFSDDDRATFVERREYGGSVLKQLDDAYAFLESRNHYRTEYEGLSRVDLYDYPAVALREALVNSVAHREYALSGPTLVSVMPSSTEIASLGGLPIGIEYADLSARISMPRNRMLANVLFRLELIEAYGTGIGRIKSSYAGCPAAPTFFVTPNTFTVDLPNRNVSKETPGRQAASDAVSSDAACVMVLLKDGPLGRAALQRSLGTSQATTLRILSALVESGRVIREGSGKKTLYRLP